MGWNWLTPSALNSLRHTTHDAKIRYAIQFATLHNSRHRPWEARLTSEFESLESTLLRSGSSSVVEHRLAKPSRAPLHFSENHKTLSKTSESCVSQGHAVSRCVLKIT